MLENDLLQYLQSHRRTPLQILCCPVYTWPEEFESPSLHFVDREITLWCHLFEKLCFQNVLSLHYNAKPVFSDSSGLKYVFEKLRFRDRLVWTLGLTVERKLCFHMPPVLCSVQRASENFVLESRLLVFGGEVSEYRWGHQERPSRIRCSCQFVLNTQFFLSLLTL